VPEIHAVGLADDSSAVGGAFGDAGGDEHVPTVAARVGEDVRIAPCLVEPGFEVQRLIPPTVGL